MRLKIEIPTETYDCLLDNCDRTSEEYTTLKNGLIVRHPQNNDVQLVQILCEQEAADRLLDFAQRVDPNAAQEIVSSIHFPGE